MPNTICSATCRCSAQPEDDRDPSQALLLLSRIAEERRDLDSALRYLDQAEPGSEGYVNIQVRRAQLLARKNDVEGARKALEDAQAESTNDGEQLQLLLAESSLLRDANRNQEAADVLKGGLQRFPTIPTCSTTIPWSWKSWASSTRWKSRCAA
jgi:uncharacterized protein HemY